MKFLIAIFLMALTTAAFSKVDCTSEPKEKWQDQQSFRKKLEADYKIKVFKVTEGNCYEVYGHDKAGKRVEIYFNPVTGEIVKKK